MKTVINSIILLVFLCVGVHAGIFSKEPPKDWHELLIMFEWNTDSGYAVVHTEKPKYLLFGQFISAMQTEKSWRKGKDEKWILEMEKYDDEIDKTDILIMVFKKVTVTPSKTGILLKRVNVNGEDLPAIGIRAILVQTAKVYK